MPAQYCGEIFNVAQYETESGSCIVQLEYRKRKAL